MSINNWQTKSFNAAGPLAANTIAKIGANDYDILQAAAATDRLIGLTTETASIAAERVDVVIVGIGNLQVSAPVTRGDFLTSDASGFGITAAPAAGVNNRVVGTALISGVAGDVIPVLINPTQIQG
jgi:hypothetical protein